jgi:hypothetical protein
VVARAQTAQAVRPPLPPAPPTHPPPAPRGEVTLRARLDLTDTSPSLDVSRPGSRLSARSSDTRLLELLGRTSDGLVAALPAGPFAVVRGFTSSPPSPRVPQRVPPPSVFAPSPVLGPMNTGGRSTALDWTLRSDTPASSSVHQQQPPVQPQPAPQDAYRTSMEFATGVPPAMWQQRVTVDQISPLLRSGPVSLAAPAALPSRAGLAPPSASQFAPDLDTSGPRVFPSAAPVQPLSPAAAFGTAPPTRAAYPVPVHA